MSYHTHTHAHMHIHDLMGFTSMRLVLCLSHEPRHIAAACILLAYRLHRQDIPEIDDSSLMVLIEDRFETLDGKRKSIVY